MTRVRKASGSIGQAAFSSAVCKGIVFAVLFVITVEGRPLTEGGGEDMEIGSLATSLVSVVSLNSAPILFLCKSFGLRSNITHVILSFSG